MSSLVDVVSRATFSLSPSGSTKLRKLTSSSNLTNENIVSRLGLVTSLADPKELTDDLLQGPEHKSKEMKGNTLLGRRAQAALLISILLMRDDSGADSEDFDPRPLIRAHWERGIAYLSRQAGDQPVVDFIIQQHWVERQEFLEEQGLASVVAPSASDRDEIAAKLAREFGRFPIEVRRLLAMVGRFDFARARRAAVELRSEVEAKRPGARLSESLALEVIEGTWRLNRLGMTENDRTFLLQLLDGRTPKEQDLTKSQALQVEFLRRLGLVDLEGDQIVPSELSRSLGKGAI